MANRTDPWEPSEHSQDTNANALYIGNLDKRVTANMIEDIFRKGLPTVKDKVYSAKMVPPTMDAMGRVCNDECGCFVKFTDHLTAELGMEFINGREFFGKKVKVRFAVESENGGPKVIGTSVSIYVGDLDEDVDDKKLKQFFDPCGEVLSVKVVKDPGTGVSKGFGFVSFSNKMDAQHAIDDMNGQQLGKRMIKTNWASRNKAGSQQQNQLNYNETYQAAGESNCTVYVGGLPGGIPNDLVRRHFQDYGNIIDARIFVEKGYAFVKFDSHAAAATAICKGNGSEMHGSFLKCWWGKEGPAGSEGGQGGGGGRREHGGGGHHHHNHSGGGGQQQHMNNNSQPNSQMASSGLSPQHQANLQQMMNMQGMNQAQQQQMMQYIQYYPGYYQQYMQWCSMMMQQQYAQAGQQQPAAGQPATSQAGGQASYINPQQYAAMYGYQSGQAQQSGGQQQQQQQQAGGNYSQQGQFSQQQQGGGYGGQQGGYAGYGGSS